MNDSAFHWPEIAEATSGTWLTQPTAPYATTVVDDNRTITPGCIFVAIVGPRIDGHDFISQVARQGVSAVCVQREPAQDILAELRSLGCGCLHVQDSLKAFQSLANLNRRHYPSLHVLAITGSCGKTSSKEMCAAVLEARWPGQVIKTTGNLNNHFGVPRTLLKINGQAQAAVIETGTSNPGEITTLATMVEPTAALICSIGAAHLEAFHDFAGVAEEKGDLLAAVPPGGTVFIPFDCPAKEVLLRHAEGRHVVTFGIQEGADVQGIYGGQCDGGYRLTLRRRDTGESVELVWPIGGEVQAGNAAGAAAVGLHFGLSLAEIAQALPKTTLPGARMAQFDCDGIHWVNDAYNANPTSMLAGLKWFAEISKQAPSRTLILGDMLELGPDSSRLHQEILQAARQLFPHDRLMTVGPTFAQFAADFEAISYPDVSAVSPDLQIAPGTWVYLKASFGTAVYKLAPKKE